MGLAFNRSRDPLSSGGNFIRRGIAFGGVKRKRLKRVGVTAHP